MRAVFLGPPGAGKGTMAQKAEGILSIPHISTGNLFRENADGHTELGLKVRSIMDRGDLVPDEITIAMVRERLDRNDTRAGFIFDGFPRTIVQAESFSKITELDIVINLQCSNDELIRRLSGRRSCPVCGKLYHVAFLPPKREGICDDDDSPLQTRKDDAPEAVQNRLNIYADVTEPLIHWYESRGLLKNVDASAAPKKVFEAIKVLLLPQDPPAPAP